jgi:hypothetical protein
MSSNAISIEVLILAFVGELRRRGKSSLILDLFLLGSIDKKLGGGECRCLNEGQSTVISEATEQPDEGLVILIIALGRDIIILEVLLAVEGDLLSLDFAILDIDLVADEHDGDALADAGQVFVPLGHVGVGDS